MAATSYAEEFYGKAAGADPVLRSYGIKPSVPAASLSDVRPGSKTSTSNYDWTGHVHRAYEGLMDCVQGIDRQLSEYWEALESIRFSCDKNRKN
mgnify:CR=1 FL=1